MKYAVREYNTGNLPKMWKDELDKYGYEVKEVSIIFNMYDGKEVVTEKVAFIELKTLEDVEELADKINECGCEITFSEVDEIQDIGEIRNIYIKER